MEKGTEKGKRGQASLPLSKKLGPVRGFSVFDNFFSEADKRF
jgi:hypothetical protein